jgi:glutaredoxin
MRPILFLILLCGFTFPAAAQVYKWVDAQGQSHYSDNPPPQSGKNIEQKKLFGNHIETDTQPFETKEATKKNPVTLYSFDDCGNACSKAQALLDKRGVPYALKNTNQDKIELKKLTGETSAPVLIVGSQSPFQGFEETAWNRLLDQAGYPKSNPLAGLHNAQSKAASVPAEAPAKP